MNIKCVESPEFPLSLEEKREILSKTYLSKNDFIRISDLPKGSSLKIFNKIRSELKKIY